jgi:hypothetical protein
MVWISCILLFHDLITVSQAGPVRQHHKRGVLPLSTTSAVLLGDVHSNNTFVKRDLGFPGRIGNYVLLSYGDTLWSDSDYSNTFRGITSDSAAFATYDPLTVYDPCLNSKGFPEQFCPIISEWGEDSSTWACGITNVVETYPGQGEVLRCLLPERG